SLEEKFLAGQGQNITPARYSKEPFEDRYIADAVKTELERAAKLLNIEGYARIDAFVKVHHNNQVEVIFIEVNSLPGMTPATCIFHQSALNGYMPYDFIDKILQYGFTKNNAQQEN
ncbi:MAG: D-alanine--D-alanine ligase, partial [Bacteroidota bacterium]